MANEMKSGKQRRKEIKAKRLGKAKGMVEIDRYDASVRPPAGSVHADHTQLSHVNSHGFLPLFYVDQPFTCRDCKTNEVWTAKQQKWWFEVAKGSIDSTAIRCSRCRAQKRREKAEQKRRMDEAAAATPHPNEAFFRRKDRLSGGGAVSG